MSQIHVNTNQWFRKIGHESIINDDQTSKV